MSQLGMGVLYLIISLSMLVILLFAWRRKHSPACHYFILIITSTILWNFANAMSYLASTSKAMIFWHEFKFLGVITVPLFTLIFALHYCKWSHRVPKVIWYVLYTLPTLFILLVATDPYFHLFRQSIQVVDLDTMSVVITENAIGFWLNTGFTYMCLFGAFLLFTYKFYKLPKYYRGQVVIILVSMLPPFFININFVFSLLDENLDLTSISFVLTGLIIYWALYYYTVPEIIPIARDLVIDKMEDLLIVTDINNRVVDINLAMKKLMAKVKLDVMKLDFMKALKLVLEHYQGYLCETENGTEVVIHNGKDTLYYSMTLSPLDEGSSTLGSVVVFHDITHHKNMLHRLEVMATTDQLTGLYNRIYVDNHLQEYQDSSLYPVALIKGGINGLKMINNALGSEVGDDILIKTARILQESTKDEAIVSRAGGDEFAIISPNTDNTMVHNILEKIATACEECNISHAKLSISFGYSIMTSTDDSIHEHFRQADDSMYRKKMMESKSTKSAIVESLKIALEQSDYETKAHAVRTQKMAMTLGKRAGLNDNQLNDLSMLAILHDIGKLAIPTHILLKPDKLTDEEYEIIKTHTEKGYNIAISSQDLMNIAHGILHHHERWDGRGYPMGLAGKDIPIESRIISIVDSYDVMTNERPYHKPMSKNAAIEELKRCKGTQFDPLLIDMMLDILGAE